MVVASDALKAVISQLNYKNLDDLSEFKNVNTTMEILSKYIHKEICKHLSGNFEGNLKVIIKESPLAYCSYEGKI